MRRRVVMAFRMQNSHKLQNTHQQGIQEGSQYLDASGMQAGHGRHCEWYL